MLYEVITDRLPHLERGQTQDHQEDCNNIEPRDNLRFGPPEQFEVMMQWRHFKHPPALTVFVLRVFEINALNNNRQSFHQKNAAKRREQQLFLDKDTHCSNSPTQGQRSSYNFV